MSTLKVFQIDGATFYAVQHPRIAAAMMAFGYAWEEVPDTPAKVDAVLKNLDDLYQSLLTLKGPSGTDPSRSGRGARSRRGKSPARRSGRLGASGERPLALMSPQVD